MLSRAIRRPRPAAPAPSPLTGQPTAPAEPTFNNPAYGAPNATGPYAGAINSFQEAQNRANAANETRYQGTLATLEGQGQSAKTDIARGGQQERGGITQDAINRGLYSTSVLDSLKGESYGREARQSAAVDESVANQRAGVMERRTDQGPDAGFYANLISQQAAGEAGSQRSFNTIGAQSGGGSGGFDPFGGMMGGGRGGSGGQQPSTGPSFGQGGGGGGGGRPGEVYSVQGTRGSSINPDGTPRIDPSYNPAGGSNIYLGDRGSVTAGASDDTTEAYWIAQGRTPVEAREMASRTWNQRHPGNPRY